MVVASDAADVELDRLCREVHPGGDRMNTTAKPATPLALSIDQACASLGVSWDTWREHIAADIRIVRVGRRRLVPIAELERWLADHAEVIDSTRCA
jgi:excisionase family DNA binding protein